MAFPRRIAIALESSGPGGAERMVLHLARGLQEAGREPVVVTLRSGWMTERAQGLGVPVWILPQARGLDPAWVLRLARRLRREEIDLLHSHEFAMNVFGGMAAVVARRPHVATLHGRAYATDRRRRALAYRGLRRGGMRLVAVSRDLAGYLAARLRLPVEALSVVPNGIPLPERRGPAGPAGEAARTDAQREARRETGLPVEARVVVAVGNLYPVKDHATLLRALAALPEDVHVAIAGRGEEEPRLRRLADELGLAPRCHLLGVRDDVPRLLATADVFAQPSRSEGLPLAVLEAMGAALPVVATRVGGLPEVVVEGETGHLVPPGDPEALATVLGRVLAGPDRGRSLGEAGRALAEREFSVRAMVERYLALYAAPRAKARPRRA